MTPHHQVRSEYLTASPRPTTTCSSQSQAPQQNDPLLKNYHLSSYAVLLEA